MPEFSSVIIGGLGAVFLGSLVQGTAGLGFALLSVPIMIYFFPPQSTMPILLILGTLVNTIILYDSRKHLTFRSMVRVSIIGVLSTPLGTLLLLQLDADSFKIFIGAAVFLIALLMLFGFSKKIQNEKRAVLPIGFASGILQGSLTMCGPPVIFFLVNQGVEKQAFRANFAAFIMVMNISAALNYSIGGLFTAEVFGVAFWLFPAVIAGGLIGIWLSRRVNEIVFKKIALIIVTIGGLSSALSGLGLW
ncbi:sulfite exporter TauE/SafE family protein [candidate division KSB1 bacterium]